jgi:glycerol-3-phosphate O-acyltransferase
MNSDSEIPEDPTVDFIGSKVYHPNYKIDLKNKLLESPALLETIETLATKANQLNPRKSIDSNKRELQSTSLKIIDAMVADLSSQRVVKMFGFTVKTLLTRLYHKGIHIDEEEVKTLRIVAKKAAKMNQSLVFLPSHKSHVDYLVVSYVLYRLGIALPHIAAGENLNMPIIGFILKYNGAFFIRREWGGDKLYIAIMKSYINILLEDGYNLEAFVEGTRSRTGKLLQPKFGFIKLILESMFQNPNRDCIIIPVNIGYDRVIETPSYITELLGTPKEKESIFQLLGSVNLLQLKWGRIDVRFGDAFSLQTFIRKFLASKQNDGFDQEQLKVMVLQSFGYRILAEVNKISVIMPTALVGTVLLTLRGRGVGRNEVIFINTVD